MFPMGKRVSHTKQAKKTKTKIMRAFSLFPFSLPPLGGNKAQGGSIRRLAVLYYLDNIETSQHIKNAHKPLYINVFSVYLCIILTL